MSTGEMNTDEMSIGEFSRLSQLSLKALRLPHLQDCAGV